MLLDAMQTLTAALNAFQGVFTVAAPYFALAKSLQLVSSNATIAAIETEFNSTTVNLCNYNPVDALCLVSGVLA